MAAPPDITQLKKASEVALSLARDFGQNIVLVISIFLTSLALFSWNISFLKDAHGALLAIAIFSGVYSLLLLWQSYRPLREARHHLKRLGHDEKQVLKVFLTQNRRTMHMNIMYAPTASLIAKGILSYATSTFPAFGAPIVIQNHAYEYLADHPHLIDLKREEIGSAEYDESDCTWLTKP